MTRKKKAQNNRDKKHTPYHEYRNPLSSRYASKAMGEIFSEYHRAHLWRQLWVWLAEEEKKLGLPITKVQIDELKKHQSNIDFNRVRLLERELKHDVMSHIRAYSEKAKKAEKIIHLGATSCYVTDNADVLILREASQLIQIKLAKVIRELHLKARRWATQKTCGYTHFQPAQPVSMGKRLCLWIQDLIWDFEELNWHLQRLEPLGCKGATGTQASFLSLFDGDFEKVKKLDQAICKKMGFKQAVPVSGQTLSRKVDSWFLSSLTQLASSFSKISYDFRLLQHTGELREPFGDKQVGSSAMAYKQNPILAERITSLSRFLITTAQNAHWTHATQWLERSLDDSANRRLSISQAFLTADALCELGLRLFSGMDIDKEMIQKRLEAYAASFATEEQMMKGVLAGGSRQKLHEEVRQKTLAGELSDTKKSITSGAAEKQAQEFLNTQSKRFLQKYRGLTNTKLQNSADEI